MMRPRCLVHNVSRDTLFGDPVEKTGVTKGCLQSFPPILSSAATPRSTLGDSSDQTIKRQKVCLENHFDSECQPSFNWRFTIATKVNCCNHEARRPAHLVRSPLRGSRSRRDFPLADSRSNRSESSCRAENQEALHPEGETQVQAAQEEIQASEEDGSADTSPSSILMLLGLRC